MPDPFEWLRKRTGGFEKAEQELAQRSMRQRHDAVMTSAMEAGGRTRIQFFNVRTGGISRLDGKVIKVNPHTHIMSFRTDHGHEINIFTAHVQRAWNLPAQQAKPRPTENPPHALGPIDVTHGPVGREVERMRPPKYPGVPAELQGDDPYTWQARQDWLRLRERQRAHEEREREERAERHRQYDERRKREEYEDRVRGTGELENPQNRDGSGIPFEGNDLYPPSQQRPDYERFKRLGGTDQEWTDRYGYWPNGHRKQRQDLTAEELHRIDSDWNKRYGPDAEPKALPAPKPQLPLYVDDVT